MLRVRPRWRSWLSRLCLRAFLGGSVCETVQKLQVGFAGRVGCGVNRCGGAFKGVWDGDSCFSSGGCVLRCVRL